MRKRYKTLLLTTLTLIVLAGCTSDEYAYNVANQDLKGTWVWCEHNDGDNNIEIVQIENDKLICEVLSHIAGVLAEKYVGYISIGDESQVLWGATSPITRSRMDIVWNVKEINSMYIRLISPMLGERQYCRVIDELILMPGQSAVLEIPEELGALSLLYSLNDSVVKVMPEGRVAALTSGQTYVTVETNVGIVYVKIVVGTRNDAILQYTKRIGLPADSLKALLAEEDVTMLADSTGVTCYVDNIIADKIKFIIQPESGCVYSYNLYMQDDCSVDEIYRYISEQYNPVREINGKYEFCDGNSLSDASYVIVLDPVGRKVSYQDFKAYDYWPDLSYYLGGYIETVQKHFSTYHYYVDSDESGIWYRYMSYDKDNSSIHFLTDKNGIVTQVFLVADHLSQRESALNYLRRKYYYKADNGRVYAFMQRPLSETSVYGIQYRPEDKSVQYILLSSLK